MGRVLTMLFEVSVLEAPGTADGGQIWGIFGEAPVRGREALPMWLAGCSAHAHCPELSPWWLA